MAITAAMVKELRELSGAGMMDCKKALNEKLQNRHWLQMQQIWMLLWKKHG